MQSTRPGPSADLERLIRRREVLVVAGLGAGAVLLGCGSARAPAASSQITTIASACTLTPEVTQGPYYIANHLTRRDVREHRPGLLLNLTLTVISAGCRPLQSADVEIWHADASGLYSGYGSSPSAPTNQKRYLRGHQKTDSHGQARFITIYPGWYTGRSPHIHLKVHVGGNTVHTGQLFFKDPISDLVYKTGSYRSHGQPDTTNVTDNIYAAAGGSRAVVALHRRSSSNLNKGFNGSAVLVVT
jgi:protocatechuate 3,4-dioxygenase beta subunit